MFTRRNSTARTSTAATPSKRRSARSMVAAMAVLGSLAVGGPLAYAGTQDAKDAMHHDAVQKDAVQKAADSLVREDGFPAELKELKTTVKADGPAPNSGYGLGLLKTELSCGRVLWGHGGDINGYETRGGVTDDGRAVTVTVAVTALPTAVVNDQAELPKVMQHVRAWWTRRPASNATTTRRCGKNPAP